MQIMTKEKKATSSHIYNIRYHNGSHILQVGMGKLQKFEISFQ